MCGVVVAGCIPSVGDGASFQRDDQADPAAQSGTDIIIEQISTEEESSGVETGGRLIPVSRDPRAYVDGVDTRIGELYQPYTRSGVRGNLQSCVQNYTARILDAGSDSSDPVPETAHAFLEESIAEIRGLEYPPVSTRIGKASISTNRRVALLPILIMTERGGGMGELECRQSDGQWQLHNIVIDRNALAAGTTPEQTQFNPLLF